VRKLVCFFLGDRELAAPIDAVRETVDLRPITPVFRTPASIAGITNLRGEILAVLDPAVLLGLPPCPRGPATRIVIVEPDDRRAGLLVDALGPIRDVSAEQIGPVPPSIAPAIAAMLDGIVSMPERPIGIVDVGRLLDAPEILPFARSDRAETPAAEMS
jgi:purine-binding chemotaxis protein CheW